MRGDNCVIFTTSTRMELRVVFDPDGKAFFCGVDLAVIAGYGAPRKAVTLGNRGVNRIESVLRKVPWDNGMRQGRCDFTCFSAENAVKVLCKRPAPYEYIRWLEDEVIPKTEEIGKEIARGYVDWTRSAETAPKEDQFREVAKLAEQSKKASRVATAKTQGKLPENVDSIMDRLDNIILECALLKRDLSQARP